MAVEEKKITQDMFEPANIDESKNEEISRESLSFWKDAFMRLMKNKAAIASGIIIILIGIMSLIGPVMNKYGIDDQDVHRSNLPPKVAALSNIHWLPFTGYEHGQDQYKLRKIKQSYWFGTDNLGRDLWTRTWKGTQISLFIGLVAAAVDLIIGVAYGGVSAYYGGKVDTVMQRIIEVLVGIPLMIMMILVIIVLQPGLTSIIIAMVITGWVGMSRIVRGQILKLKKQEYVMAATTLGASNTRVISKHLVPNTLGQIIIQTMFTIPNAIFFEAFLSFIGLGIKDPLASLGSLINSGYELMQIHPYQITFPGIIISLLLICFNILGDGLRDAFDPKLRK